MRFFSDFVIALAVSAPLMASAQQMAEGDGLLVATDDGYSAPVPSGNAVAFTLGLGPQVTPSYFGSDNYVIGPTGSLSSGYLRWGGHEFGSFEPQDAPLGFDFSPSFRIISPRAAADNPELAGLTDLELALELGAGVSFTQPNWSVFGDLRYGVVGHEGTVGEMGLDLILRPIDALTLQGGPRAFYGDDTFSSTYFGVTPAEAAASSFNAYQSGAGFLSAGVEITAQYALGGQWGLDGTLRWDRLTGDAADSPLVLQGSADQFSASLVATRRFSFEF
jgi:outer membrane protein